MGEHVRKYVLSCVKCQQSKPPASLDASRAYVAEMAHGSYGSGHCVT
jgi:hypothetical protein